MDDQETARLRIIVSGLEHELEEAVRARDKAESLNVIYRAEIHTMARNVINGCLHEVLKKLAATGGTQ